MMYLYVALLYTAAIASVIVGALVLIRDWKKIENRAFFGVSMGIFLWAVGIAGFLASRNLHVAFWWAKAYYIAPIILVLSSVVFAKHFGSLKKLPKIVTLPVYASGYLLIGLLLTQHNFLTRAVIHKSFGNEVLLVRSDYFIYAAFIIFCFALAIGLLFVKSRTFNQPAIRQQSKTLFFGYLISCIIGLYYNLILPALGNYTLIMIGPMATAIFLSSTAYAIVRHKLFDIGTVVARSLGYIATSAALAIAYGFIVFGAMKLMFKLSIPTYALITISIFMGLSGFAFPLLKKTFDRITNKYFFRDAYDAQELFSELNNTLASSLSPGFIIQKASEIISRHLKVTYAVFSITDTESRLGYLKMGSKYSLHNGANLDWVRTLTPRIHQPVLVADYLETKNTEMIRTLMHENGIAALVRLTSNVTKNDEGLGYMMLGQKKSGNPYSSKDIKVLEAVTNELIIAIQNALHYEEIQRFNETLEAKVEDATRKLKVTNDKLKKIDETKDEFISMASHQLRTPLTSVKGYVSMVLDGDVGPINDQQRQLLNQSFQSSQRMANLISDLLNLSRINTGKFVIDASPLNLNDIVTEEFNQLREMAEAKNIDFTYDAPADFPTLMFDDGKMHQVVMNLMDNALYYTPPGGTVSVQLVETPNTIEFRVVDSGIGVPRDAQKFLFTKMYRADNARRARPDGTGLGLFLVKKVVAEQKGATIFETEENKGSTFGFRFNKRDHLVPEGYVATTV